MKRFIAFLTLAFCILLVGCGSRVDVPPAHVGKILTKDGYREGLIPTSRIRLDFCQMNCDALVILDISDQAFSEPLEIFVPKDKLKMTVTVRATLSVNPKKTEELFTLITPVKTKNPDVSLIESEKVYKTYAQQIILSEVREYLSQYSIAEIASSTELINNELAIRLTKSIADRTPFNVRHVGLTNIAYPPLIVDAQENAAERREQIQQEEAQLQISKVKLERELQEARLNRQIDKEKAETEAESQRIQSTTISAQVLELRKLENQRAWIEKWNGQLPATTLGDAVPMVNLK
jgi:regulator of protease activity HflC (stomatin/prohibitin superfamily)